MFFDSLLGYLLLSFLSLMYVSSYFRFKLTFHQGRECNRHRTTFTVNSHCSVAHRSRICNMKMKEVINRLCEAYQIWNKITPEKPQEPHSAPQVSSMLICPLHPQCETELPNHFPNSLLFISFSFQFLFS